MQYYSLRQFAEVIGVSYPTARAMRDRGEIETIKVGGIFRVPAGEAKKFSFKVPKNLLEGFKI